MLPEVVMAPDDDGGGGGAETEHDGAATRDMNGDSKLPAGYAATCDVATDDIIPGMKVVACIVMALLPLYA